MDRQGFEWNDLAVILAIGRAESLSGAARILGKTHSTVFRQINAIESRTGVRFFERFPHGYLPTEAGQVAMAYAERVEGEFHELGRKVLGRDSALRGPVRVTSPEGLAQDLAPGIIARFCAAHPDIRVNLTPDHKALDLNKREAEVAIRVTNTPPENSFGRKVCTFNFAFYARADYLAETAAVPMAARSFCLVEGAVPWLVPMLWKTRAEGERRTVFQSTASRAVLNATAEGMGVTLLPCHMGDGESRLVRASDVLEPLAMGLWVLTHPDLRGTARIRALMAHLYDELGALTAVFTGDRG